MTTTSPLTPVDLTPEQLAELETLTTNVERALLPVVRERDEAVEETTRQSQLQSIHSSITSL